MLTEPTQRSSAHRLTKLYVFSLSIVACLSILGQLTVQHQLKQQERNVRIVGEGSKHQIMNQQLSKAALAVRLSPNLEQRQKRLEELQAIVNTWEAPSKSLRSNMLAVVSAQDQAELEQMFATIEPKFQTMLKAAREILAENQGSTNPKDSSQYNQRNNLAVARILATEYAFTQGIDQIINLYSQRVKQGIDRLQKLEFGLLGITLVVLLIEGILIFKPAVQKLHQALQNVIEEREKSERLLLNILPEAIADQLKQEPGAIADGFSNVTVLFADIVGFTELSNRLTPTQAVVLLNQIFSRFDALAEKYNLEKIKTIGDAYMVVGGVPTPRPDHEIAMAQMALEMQAEIQAIGRNFGESLEMRIGINSGPVVAGVIGTKKFIYDLWGDTVNIASRMESHGKPGMIQVSETTFHTLKEHFCLEERGVIQIKGKGEMQTYWLRGVSQNTSDQSVALIK